MNQMQKTDSVIDINDVWNNEEDQKLMDAYNIFESQWKKISEAIPGKTEFQCIQRWEMLQNEQLTIWTREEDEQLIQLVLKYGENWKQLALIMKNKTQTQIETRFIDLNIIFNSQPWNEEEDNKLLYLFDQYGTKWNQIVKLMKDRSEIEVKYRYYTKHKISDNQMTLNLKISDSEIEKQEELEIKTFKTEVQCKQELQNIEPQPNKKVNIQQSEQYYFNYKLKVCNYGINHKNNELDNSLLIEDSSEGELDQDVQDDSIRTYKQEINQHFSLIQNNNKILPEGNNIVEYKHFLNKN